MRKQKIQFNFVKNHILENGSISRNFCLHKYMTRLSAYILDLKKEGFEIKGKYIKNKNGKDYVYTLISSPYKKEILYSDNKLIKIRYVKIQKGNN